MMSDLQNLWTVENVLPVTRKLRGARSVVQFK